MLMKECAEIALRLSAVRAVRGSLSALAITTVSPRFSSST